MDCIGFYAISAEFQSFNGVYSNDQQFKEGSTKIVNYMTPGFLYWGVAI